MKPVTFIILKAGRPLALVNIGLGLRAGVLMPGIEATSFIKRNHARRAILRSKRAADRLRHSLLADYPKIAPLLAPEPYVIVPLVK